MSTAPRAQFTNSHHTTVASSGSSYSGSGRFLPSITRRIRLSRDQRSADYEAGTSQQTFQHAPPSHQRRVNFMLGTDENEGQDTKDGVIFNMRQKPSCDEGGLGTDADATSRMRRWIHRRDSEDVGSSSPDNQEISTENSSHLLHGTWQSHPGKALVYPEESIQRKLDRKAIARRHLVCGLTGASHALDKGVTTGGGGRAREDVKRASSFNCHTGEHGPPAASNGKQSRSTTNSLLRNRAIVRQTIGSDRAREALDNFNNLVHELHAEHHQDYLRQGSAHLAVLSDAGADSSGGSHKETFDGEDRLTSGKSNKKLSRTSSMTFTDMKFPVGIGFTRYRPLTPNLLLRLDKLKMPVKRRTQQWVNNIQENKRTLSKSSIVDTPAVKMQPGKEESCAMKKDHEKAMVKTNTADEPQKPCKHSFL